MIGKPKLTERLHVIGACLLAMIVCSSSPSHAAPPIIAKSISLSGGFMQLKGGAHLAIDPYIRADFPAAFAEIQSRIDALPTTGTSPKIRGYIPKALDGLSPQQQAALSHPESYILNISPTSIEVLGGDSHGVLYGLTTLENMIVENNGRIPLGSIIDWPDHRIRALHLVARFLKAADIMHWINEARKAKMNTLFIDLRDGVALKSLQGIALSNAMTISDILSVVKYARESGFEFIPEIKLLTHQDKLLAKTHPEILVNKKDYNPNFPNIYTGLVFPILDEIISLFHPQAIHIGHDEVVRWGSRLKPGETLLPSALFLQDILIIHRHLKTKGVQTWMWGDMLISPDEFPSMLARHLHGTLPGYGRALRHKLPKDIVICDWHYFDKQKIFPSLSTMTSEGFHVLGATWKSLQTTRNFSRYAYSAHADGMIATTWWPVQARQNQLVSQIIKDSGRLFWTAQ